MNQVKQFINKYIQNTNILWSLFVYPFFLSFLFRSLLIFASFYSILFWFITCDTETNTSVVAKLAMYCFFVFFCAYNKLDICFEPEFEHWSHFSCDNFPNICSHRIYSEQLSFEASKGNMTLKEYILFDVLNYSSANANTLHDFDSVS